MFDAKRLLEDFLGGGNPGGGSPGGGAGFSKAGTFAAGAATGGLAGLLLGSKKAKKIGGSLLGYGGAAVLGGLAYRAWQNHQNRSTAARTAEPAAPMSRLAAAAATRPLPAPADSPFDPGAGTAADGQPFALALVRAMIAAAKADGHIDAEEQSRLFARINELQLDAEAKAFVFDELGRDTDLDAIAALPRGPEQAAEIWLAARLAIDPDDAREKAYITALAAKLKLPTDLVKHLDAQAGAAIV